MFYHIANALRPHCNILNLFHYVSFRSIAALLTSILFSFIFGNWFIKATQDRFKSKPRKWTPENHLTKNNTPTMGGIFILMVCVVNTLLWNNLTKKNIWVFLFCIISFGSIGFLDDLLKLRRSKGISAKLKFSLQFIFSAATMILWYFWVNPNTMLCIPFFKNITPTLGLLMIPWGMFILMGTSNAVNLTDGLDGLATGPLMANFSTFAFIAYLTGHKFFSKYLHIVYSGNAEMTIVCTTLLGALIGFLWYNTYPAQIFMGDVGSLALGATLGLVALITRQELLLPIAGGIFVLETLSVIIQLGSYRFLGRRMFKMAPIHHHFELVGWKEAKITVRFWIISIILSLIALLTLKIR
jgi:phospho-N-acetylmuramoyl-pentapeptide-transferase